ncbi:MAG: glycine zipper 2TM domain-containing protein [Ramlibacter sp.]
MDNTVNSSAQPGREPAFGDRLRSSKALIPTLAVMAVTVAALATTLVVTRTNANSNLPVALAAPARPEVVPVPPLSAAPALAPARVAAVVQPAAAPIYHQPPVQVAQAPVCHSCGVVESVVAVQHQGQPRGIAGTQVTPGMAIGGVVGGLLGNQIGHGNGRAATTVLGAAGGAYAGHAIEKNTTRYTTYQMRIRMNDGTVRTVEQRSSVALGSHVVVDHGAVRLARAATLKG